MDTDKTEVPEDDIFGKVISTYTRADMLADGGLVDVTKLAKEARFRFPVAVTSSVWEGYINPSKLDASQGQDANGRLWDTLNVLLVTIKRSQGGDRVNFKVIYMMHGKSEKVSLKAIVGPGDNREPVITIMLPDED